MKIGQTTIDDIEKTHEPNKPYGYEPYGFEDPRLVREPKRRWGARQWISLTLALLLIVGVWFALNQKLLFGDDWLSATYDNPDWKTNEGNLHTFGAWDLETHIWKAEYIKDHYPNFGWNPYWYLGMPLVKYYPAAFYFINIFITFLTGATAAKAALMMVIFGHLLAALLTFFVCYKVSRKIWASALCATFVISNTFLTIRSYGWEPITVVFLFLFPLGLYLFFKAPLRPFRFWLILVLGIAYICHPLIWFSLCMIMGIYLLSIALRKDTQRTVQTGHYLVNYVVLVFLSLLVGAVQFLPQFSYLQVTSGAHMGLKYLPFYQVPPNIITLKDFFFDAGNLKGPGPIIMIAFLLLSIFIYLHYFKRIKVTQRLHEHPLIVGLALTLLTMVMFYYMELYNIFPMNMLRSIQYHRIIPEFLITAAVLVAALSNMAVTRKQKILYHSLLIAFVIASGIIVYSVQEQWMTTPQINNQQEFIHDEFTGRMTFPYTDQSLAVRNSFTQVHSTYGYYEQGITNSYADEVFSVSSGYHNAPLTLLYLQATNVERIYVNMEEGTRDQILISRLNGTLPFTWNGTSRYAYFTIPLTDPSYAQAVDAKQAQQVNGLAPGCRELFKETYCGSVHEEFVGTDPAEVSYLLAYVEMLDTPYVADADMIMDNPNEYVIKVTDARDDTAVVVKMTYDADFTAVLLDGEGNEVREVDITTIGPDFMLISPQERGDYTVLLRYRPGIVSQAGILISVGTVLILSIYFLVARIRIARSTHTGVRRYEPFSLRMRQGDMK